MRNRSVLLLEPGPELLGQGLVLGAAALLAEEAAHPLEAVDALEDAWGHELALEGSLPLRQKQVS